MSKRAAEKLETLFADPPAEYRGKPFWAWNGRLEAEELRRQVRVMKRMGLGGFFMHSRVGLATPYLSDEWFRMIRACMDEAGRQGMEAWLYDEDRWPSGAAGGLVTSDERYRQRRLALLVLDPGQRLPEDILAVFCATVDGCRATGVRRLPADFSPSDVAEGQKVLAFVVRTAPPSPWYNGGAYLDTMSHEAVQRFIEITHEAYRKHVGQQFGGLIPGIFTDEPNYGGVVGAVGVTEPCVGELQWTGQLPRVFQERYGRDLLDDLPELFFEVEGRQTSGTRYRYVDCCAHLFADAFGRQVGEWCGRNSLPLTGHVLAESTLCSQTGVVGSAMRPCEFMQIPGIDILTEHWWEYSTAKQCASVTHQMGRRWMLSELYGCTGWDFGFEGHKLVGDWQAALGVNLRCQHLSWYTMAGQAKRDYPASISFQSPWWPHYRKVEDYFARVGVLMSHGEPVRRLLVVHPVESVWCRLAFTRGEDETVQALEKSFDDLLHWLLEEHIDFDYGDEDIMSRHAALVAGPEPRFRVGRAEYNAVLAPPMLTIRSSTLALLRQCAEAGVAVFLCGEPPRCVDGQAAAPDLPDNVPQLPYNRRELVRALSPNARVLSILDEHGNEKREVLYQLRRDGEAWYLFMCNTHRELDTGPLTVRLEAEGHVQLWDAETGERFAVESQRQDGLLRFETRMAPAGSRLFVISSQREELSAPPEFVETRKIDLSGAAWQTQLSEPNVLVLDRARRRVADGEWRGPQEILRADTRIRESIGLPARGGQMVQPWARPPQQEGPSAAIELLYTFEVEQVPPGPLFLAMEQPERLEAAINGRPIAAEGESGWWVDPAIRMLPLDVGMMKRGRNELLLQGTFDGDSNLEAIFILGAFAADVAGVQARIIGPLAPVHFGDWTVQGLPFYGGSVIYRTQCQAEAAEGERVFVEVPKFAGSCVRVLVDGKEAGIIGWQPYEVDITEFLSDGQAAEIAVEVVSHRRNTFGPLHHVEAAPAWVGPAEFTTDGQQWRDDYNLVPCGCLSAPRLSVRRPA